MSRFLLCLMLLLLSYSFCNHFIVMVHSTPTAPRPFNASKDAPVFYLSTPKGENTISKYTVSSTPPAKNSNLEILAKAHHAKTRLTLGWDYLQISTRSKTEDAYFYGGFLEGFLTANESSAFFLKQLQKGRQDLTPPSKTTAWEILQVNEETDGVEMRGSRKHHEQISAESCETEWMNEHLAYLQVNMNLHTHPNPKDQLFWDQVRRLWKQIEGLAAGYSAASGKPVSAKTVYLQNFVGMGAVTNYCNIKRGEARSSSPIFHRTHCSALIRPVANDLFVSHDTWSAFPWALAYRIYKVYAFPEATVAFSGYPGSIASGDDWYVTSHQLAVQETTNDVFNTSLFRASVPHTVGEVFRVMSGNYLATNGADWSYYFAFNNSGGYNNQYMAVDFKKYTPGSPIQDGLLWVAEQLPGMVESADMSHVIRSTSYWASYNIPYFKKIYDLSGYQEMKEKQGSFWSYTKYARAEIFQRNHTDVIDLESMQHMMRYNDWQMDPLSKIPNCKGTTAGRCNPSQSSMLSIASRGDLMKVYATPAENLAHYGSLYGLVAQGCFGASDSKIARWQWRETLQGLILNGPTNDQQPTFNWSGACAGQKPAEAAPVFDFPWLEVTPAPNW